MTALDRLVGDPGAFARDAWGTRPHLFHGEADDLAGLLTLDDVDHLLTEVGPRTPQLRVVRDGTVVPARDWTHAPTLGGARLSGLVDVRAVLDLVDDGATLVLQGLQRWWPRLATLVTTLEGELGHPCQANAYLTPATSQGFDWHADAHDVFVVQTHGTKRWHLRDGDGIDDSDGDEVDLSPGHCLYLPRGTEHAPRALDGASLHVTIGVQPWTWRHVVDRAVRRAVDTVELDRPLPVGWHHDPAEGADTLTAMLRTVVDGMAQDPDAALADEARRFTTTRTTTLRGGLRERLRTDDLRDEDEVHRRPGPAPLVVDDGPDHVVLLLPDREVRIPAWVGPALRDAVSREVLRPVDLAPGLSASSRVVLVRRLLREGAFRI